MTTSGKFRRALGSLQFGAAAMVALWGVGIRAQEVPLVTLAPQDVTLAVSAGNKAKGGQRGLVLRDSGQGFLKAMAAMDKGLNGHTSSTPSSGFWLEAWTPLSWIEQLASNSAKQFRPLTIEGVTPEMQEAVFRVVVHPDSPTQVSANGMAGTSSVEHVVLRSENKQIVIQPLSVESFTEEAANAMGGKATFQGVIAKFPLDGLREVRGGDGEFFITVIGVDRENKDFKVKSKHFSKLR